jgi:serine/threonine protein kinase
MADRYKIYEQLGAGGVGTVFRAYDSQLKRWVAIKRLMITSEVREGGGDLQEELRQEADSLASLRHPNIVTIFDVASDDEGLFIVMELLEGEDLADVVARGPLPYDDFKELAYQTLEGLLAAHQRHILHRDIKPENIKAERLPGGRMQAKIIDFGLARVGLRARKQTEDVSGTVLGSIHYMAPEQLTREPVDERTDLYSLGCVFYEALSGRKAFDGPSMADVIDKHINHDVVPLHAIAPTSRPGWVPGWSG